MDSKIALFDLDGSMADYEGALRTQLESMRATEEPPLPDNLHDAERHSYIKARMDCIKARPGFWRELEPITQGLWMFNTCKDMGFENHILTKGPGRHPLAWQEKVEWVHQHLGADMRNIHIVSDKGLMYGHVLYDDYPPYMKAWLKYRTRGLGVMPVTTYNGDFEHPNVVKYDGGNYDHLLTCLEVVLRRDSQAPLVLPAA